MDKNSTIKLAILWTAALAKDPNFIKNAYDVFEEELHEYTDELDPWLAVIKEDIEMAVTIKESKVNEGSN